MTNCPHCGSDSGYYKEVRVTGTMKWYYDMDGTPGDNTNSNDSLFEDEGPTKYCADCHQSFGIAPKEKKK